ncbi:hypothetical protein EMIT07CA2_110160 [Brevibacillus sp. IT-7CA2]
MPAARRHFPRAIGFIVHPDFLIITIDAGIWDEVAVEYGRSPHFLHFCKRDVSKCHFSSIPG